MFRQFLNDQRGATAIEYGLIAVLVCIGCLGGIMATGTSIETMWGSGTSPIQRAFNG